MTSVPPHTEWFADRRREALGLTVRIPWHLKDFECDDFLLYTPADYTPGKEEAQDSFSREQFQERREVCDGVLEASVLMNQLWREDSGFRGFVHESTESFQTSVHKLRVVVEDEDVTGLCGFQRLVDRDGESAVPFVPEDADVRELLPDLIDRAVGGGIVDEDDLPLSDGLEARDRQVDPVEAGHDDGQIHAHRLYK